MHVSLLWFELLMKSIIMFIWAWIIQLDLPGTCVQTTVRLNTVCDEYYADLLGHENNYE